MISELHPEQRIAIANLMDESGVRFGTSGARGLVADMTSELCFAYTAAFLQAVPVAAGRVALAVDLRPSSLGIAAACAAAIERAGLIVDFCGAIPTPALAFYAQEEGVPALMVTGSHIPFDRNGIKFYGMSGEITKVDEANIRRAVVSVPKGGRVVALPAVNADAERRYIDRYLSFFPPSCLAGMRLAFYEHSSVARDLLRTLLEALGAEVISLGRVDEFVPIDTEAVSAEDVLRARNWAAEYGFDAIISTDGDGDRPLVGDESGAWLRGDVAGILCAQYLQARAVVTTVSCNTAVEWCEAFSQVLRTRIGSPYVIEGIEDLLAEAASGEGAEDGRPVVGFEPNGGFLLGSAVERGGRALAPLLTRDAALPILCLLVMAWENGGAVSELCRRLPPRFTASGRLQGFAAAESSRLLADLSASPGAIDVLLADLCGGLLHIDETDGLRMAFDSDQIVHFRPSGNAPELRCYAESGCQASADQLVVECLRRMKGWLEIKDAFQIRALANPANSVVRIK